MQAEHEIDVLALRLRIGATQAALGTAAGVDQSTVSNWERGMQPRGSALKVLKLIDEGKIIVPAQPEKAVSQQTEAAE